MADGTTGIITIEQAAALLMISKQWVRDLCRKGYIDKAETGKVPLVGAVQGYIRWLKDEERRTSKSASASAVQQARAKEIEMRMARDAGELLQREDVEAFCADALAIFRSDLSGVPAASTRDLKTRRAIEKNLNEAIARLEDTFGQYRSAERIGLSGVDVADEARAPG
jgi:hypothetical protein